MRSKNPKDIRLRLKFLIQSPGQPGERKTIEVECAEGRCLIGRSHSDVVLDDERCSRRNTLIYLNERRTLMIRDLESRNGTHLNEKNVKQSSLQAGDTFRIGKTLVALLSAEQSKPALQTLDEDSLPKPGRGFPLPVVRSWPDYYDCRPSSDHDLYW